MFHNNNSNKSHGREFCLHLRRARPKLPEAWQCLHRSAGFESALEEAEGKKKKAEAASDERQWAYEARAGPWRFSPREPLPCVSGQENTSVGELDTVGLRAHQELTESQPQPKQLPPHGLVAPRRTPALLGSGGTVNAGAQCVF